MFKDIIKQLMNTGKTIDDIAALFTNELNAEIKAQEAEEERIRQEIRKQEDAAYLAKEIDEFCDFYYPELLKYSETMRSENLIQVFDALAVMIPSVEATYANPTTFSKDALIKIIKGIISRENSQF